MKKRNKIPREADPSTRLSIAYIDICEVMHDAQLSNAEAVAVGHGILASAFENMTEGMTPQAARDLIDSTMSVLRREMLKNLHRKGNETDN